ncbi:amino acid ABC transporter permease [Nakamurella flavida]|uniref:Amino acid ABC transporter permease n=1 Tax=Nakamurella flavida TaxID=363630 RepID=A0A938YRX0_9ACTN|nr:amino acid ABC transporter permease [Nakamurella flavida]MBM9478317.1 amino acid ABC transporter permease [Nakamurella flavida]MDP9777512.1 glutamate transport system permease protein [Nakamurella flavida]
MSDRLSVLYDHPGPKARRRNAVLSVVVALLLLAGLWWIYDTLNGKNQLTAQKWEPFLTAQMWTTYLLPGLLETLKAAALSVIISIPVGALLGVARLSDHAWLRWVAGIVVEFFRAIPVLILMVFAAAFYALYTGVSSGARPLVAVVTALVLYNGSVLAEVFRAGILSLPKGQTEAAVAIGMRKTQVMTQILLPQALTVMLPAVISQLVVIVKDTALGGILLSFAELRRAAGTAASVYGNFLAVYVVVAAIYIALNLLLGFGAGYVEKRMRVRRGGGTAGLEPITGVGEAGVPAALVPDDRAT